MGSLTSPASTNLGSDVSTRAALLDRLDAIDPAIVDSALTAARLASLDKIDPALGAAAISVARMAALDKIDPALGAAAISAARIAGLDNLDALISSRAAAASYTAGRAAFLDVLNVLQNGGAGVGVLYPSLAAYALPTSGGVAWTMGAFAQIVAAVAGNMVLAGVFLGTQLETIEHDVEIAQGAAAAEVVIARASIKSLEAAGFVFQYINFPVPIQLANNARLSVRNASSFASHSMFVKALCLPRPVA